MNAAQLRNQAEKGSHYKLVALAQSCQRFTEFLRGVVISMVSITRDVEPVRVEHANVGVMVLLRKL